MARVCLAVSYDTEHAVPQRLPDWVASRCPNAESESKLWSRYLNELIWEDPEHLERSVVELETIASLADLFCRYDGEFTSFVLGRWLDFVGEALGEERLRRYFGQVAEVGTHSYDHLRYLSSGDIDQDQIAGVLPILRVEEQLLDSTYAIVRRLKRPCFGLRTPMGNTRPFRENERLILAAMERTNLHYVSSWLKADQRVWNRVQVQPFRYGQLGYERILEIPGVGAYDVHFVQPTKRLVFGDLSPSLTVNGVRMDLHYMDLLHRAIRYSEKIGRTVVVPLVFHPHAVPFYDPELKMHGDILRFCQDAGIRAVTYQTVSQMF